MSLSDRHIPEPLLHGLLDGELDAANALACEEHLARCPDCAGAYAQLQALSAALRGADLGLSAPLQLKYRVQSMLAGARGVARWRKPIPAIAGSVAAALAACALLVVAVLPRSLSLADQVAESHVRSLMADHLMDVASTDHHTVKPWFAGRLAFSPPVYDLAQDGFPLAGARVDYIAGHEAAALVYRHGGHVINLYVWPAGPRDLAPVPPLSRQGYNVRGWTRDGMSFWAVSDMSAEELARFESLARAAPTG
jgi:anti-sigma factor RsiW